MLPLEDVTPQAGVTGVRFRAGPQGAFNIKAVAPIVQDMAPWRGQEPGGSTQLGVLCITKPFLLLFKSVRDAGWLVFSSMIIARLTGRGEGVLSYVFLKRDKT